MNKGKKLTIWEKEWNLLEKKESQILTKYRKENLAIVNKKLEAVVPEKLQEKLNLAFYKAFQMVFEKGSKVIEKTYSKQNQVNEYKIRDFTAELKKNRKSMKAFSKQASVVSNRNLIFSGVEGLGLGILGVGIPDIPLFIGLIIKSIYEITLSYGFSYESEEERFLILKIIQTSLERGKKLEESDFEINQWMEGKMDWENDLTEQLKTTANTLSKELLYMKFIQGIPIAGVVGGLSDAIYLKRITDYAMLKYKRRFLLKKIPTNKD